MSSNCNSGYFGLVELQILNQISISLSHMISTWNSSMTSTLSPTLFLNSSWWNLMADMVIPAVSTFTNISLE